MTDDRDWRKFAHLRKEHWPEAIPPMGPRREYGPYPWTEKVHHDPLDLDGYPHTHPAAASLGDYYMGDVCPYCGVPLARDERVVTITGDRGEFHDVDELENPTPAFHPECWRERQAEKHGHENSDLGAFVDV